ncbi:MAG TPA: DUF3037 domain-containing protein [Ktedonobacterales bacterium]|nr:DUF3037 domain-containing protein [Ktedonobacterales bacterium]
MRADYSYDYAIIQVVPSVERGERINVGVIVLCRACSYLGLRYVVDEQRLRALAPTLDVAEVAAYLHAMERMSMGDPQAGPIAEFSQTERFHWLVAPSSTIVQTSPVHSGLCDDPAAALDDLMARMV